MSVLHPKLEALQRTLLTPSALTQVNDPWLAQRRIELWLKRDDLIHPIISGNKWRKLKYILQHVLSVNADTLISMGGAYSNHLHALAFAGQQLGINTIGLVRGEAPSVLNPTLQDVLSWGMTLNYVTRVNYRELRHYKHWQALPGLSAGQYWLPEGGAVELALQGVAELVTEMNQPDAILCVPCGTGTTLAGIIANSAPTMTILGFAALKGAGFLNPDVHALLPLDKHFGKWSINLDYHCGGFGKVTQELLQFMQRFEYTTGIALDHVYTGKMLLGIYDLITQGYFKAGQKIIAVHTGGLQGARVIVKH